MANSSETFYLKWDEHINACLLGLKYSLLGFDSNIAETTKYGMACFLYKGKPKFYLGIDLKKNKEPYVLFVDGNQIADTRLEQGSRKKMKIYRVDPNKDINKVELYELLKIAVDLTN